MDVAIPNITFDEEDSQIEISGHSLRNDPGPHDPSVLYEQDEHISSAVWEGLERGALRCHEHTSKLEEWKLTGKQLELVEKAGFKYFRKIEAFSLDNQLISALVERWRKETNTFHLPGGEMTITLDEVALNLGLAIDGEPVVAVELEDSSAIPVCEKLLGKKPTSNDRRGGILEAILGSTIFSTTSGNTVPVIFLPLFEDFEKAGKYAWGAAALAFLYRALGNATSKSQSTISGCLTLLQCWSYWHLNIGRPKLNQGQALDAFPLALRWKQKLSGLRSKCDVVQYRKALDSLQPCDVEWLPYHDMDEIVPEDIKDTLILGRSRTTLICLDKAEKHLPDRCLRQFGFNQPIPQEVPQWKGTDGEADQSKSIASSCEDWSKHRDQIVEGEDRVDDSEYLLWYSNITRKFVGRHTSLESMFRQTVAGMTKMLELAKTLSREDMFPVNQKAVENIKNILNESLKNPFSNSKGFLLHLKIVVTRCVSHYCLELFGNVFTINQS
ncbi:PROTEIN MAIN-LIKE 2 [Salix koriyanagi]|uniref:PROTEIN MAIN-LIKE 2 n=1 Tax=Salix koriyanagi TaxID=2511006 RepID=A0A9Q0T4J3_9ROSI|nr:PROTEIN MAIN-LIKE 2 [Salix koriyanagi]